MTYEVVTRLPSGKERVQSYATDDSIAAGDVLRLGGRFWLVESVEDPSRVLAKPARYRRAELAKDDPIALDEVLVEAGNLYAVLQAASERIRDLRERLDRSARGEP